MTAEAMTIQIANAIGQFGLAMLAILGAISILVVGFFVFRWGVSKLRKPEKTWGDVWAEEDNKYYG